MSLTVSLSGEITTIIRPAETATFRDQITINRIVDIPSERKVIVFIEGLGRIVLEDLSDSNYDTPNEWTNADVQAAVLKHIQSMN